MRKKIFELLIKNLQLIENQCFGSEKKFAEKLKISPQTFNRYTRADSAVPVAVLLKIEDLTGIPIKMLIEEDLSERKFPKLDRLPGFVKYDDKRESIKLSENPVLKDLEPEGFYRTAPPPDELAALKEKVDMLWQLNLHRAGRIEELEMRLKVLESELARLRGEG